MTYYAADEVWRGNLPTPAEGRVAILRLMRDEQSMKHDPPSVSRVLRMIYLEYQRITQNSIASEITE